MSFGRWILEELKTGQGDGSDADTVLMYDIFKKINKQEYGYIIIFIEYPLLITHPLSVT